MLFSQGFPLALIEKQGGKQFGAPGSFCSQHSLVRGGYKKALIPYFPHYCALGPILLFNTNLPEHFFCWQQEKKQNSEQNAFQSPGPRLPPTSPKKAREPRSGLGCFLPSPQGACFIPSLKHCLINTATTAGLLALSDTQQETHQPVNLTPTSSNPS